MQKPIQLSNYQLLCLLFMHSLGSSTIFALGMRAKQDAWLVVLSGLLLGLAILSIHIALQNQYPQRNLVQISQQLLGKVGGNIVSLLFAGYFFWVSTLNFSEFAELIALAALAETPIWAIQGIFILLIIYLTWKGIEVIGRMSELLMPFIILFLLLVYLLIVISGRVDLKELQPVLAYGILPVIKETYPRYTTFPYGEDVVFLMYYCYVNTSLIKRRYVYSAAVIIGLLLTLSTVIIIGTFSVPLAASSTIPLLGVTKMINIGNIITNIDAIVVIIFFVGGLFKAMLFFYGAVLTIQTAFNLKREMLILTLAVVLVVFNLIYIPNFVFHRFIGIAFGNSYLHEIYTIYIPLLLLLLTWLQQVKKQLTAPQTREPAKKVAV